MEPGGERKRMVRIGLSYHAGKAAYDAYADALERRAKALNMPIEMVWLAGRDRDLDAAELERVNAVCLTGGADVDPARYGRADAAHLCSIDARRDDIEWAILEELDRRPRPLLAICRGAQLLNVFHGGTLVPDLGELNHDHRPVAGFSEHPIRIAPESLLSKVARLTVGTANSSHHQAVDRIAPGFRISAHATDGVVEAFERGQDSEPFLLAVQWHPERMAPGERLADAVLDAFLQSVGAGANRHPDASIRT
jgi:putative glutamine amidotransferase